MESQEKKETSESKPKFESEALKTFKEGFEQEKAIEGKIEKGLEVMKGMISDPGKGSLKDFWDIKKLIGPLFKEKIDPMKRQSLWSQYTALGDEARKIKEIKDEEAAFLVEQVEIAITALEEDLAKYEALVEGIPHFNFPKGLNKLSLNEREYHKAQRELQLLKILVQRLDALRKEILAIDMRISHKNKILRRLSAIGDQVFPKRKELIKQVSDQFIKDVESFVSSRFPEGEEKLNVPYYVVLGEIKSLQSLAKQLTLNTQSFTKTRALLNSCWDKIKDKEKDYRAEMGEKLEEQKKNYAEILPQIEAFETFCANEENHARAKILDASNDLQEKMKGISYSREQIKELKERIQKARSGALEKIDEHVNKKKHAAKQQVEDLKTSLAKLIEEEEKTSLEDLEKGEENALAIYQKLTLSPAEVHQIERQFADLKSFIFNKKEGVISKDELEHLYEERAAHLEVIKSQMEEYRKEMGGSNLDFEKAMTYRELYDSAKIHFDSEMEALEHLEEKLI